MSERLRQQGTSCDIVVVTFTKARNLRGYQRRFAPGLTVVTDPDLVLYRALGFGRGSVRRVWGWRSARRYIELIAAGARPERSSPERSTPEDSTPEDSKEDTLQLGGNAVLDASGVIRWIYAGEGPDDRPTADEVAVAVDRCRST